MVHIENFGKRQKNKPSNDGTPYKDSSTFCSHRADRFLCPMRSSGRVLFDVLFCNGQSLLATGSSPYTLGPPQSMS